MFAQKVAFIACLINYFPADDRERQFTPILQEPLSRKMPWCRRASGRTAHRLPLRIHPRGICPCKRCRRDRLYLLDCVSRSTIAALQPPDGSLLNGRNCRCKPLLSLFYSFLIHNLQRQPRREGIPVPPVCPLRTGTRRRSAAIFAHTAWLCRFFYKTGSCIYMPDPVLRAD